MWSSISIVSLLWLVTPNVVSFVLRPAAQSGLKPLNMASDSNDENLDGVLNKWSRYVEFLFTGDSCSFLSWFLSPTAIVPFHTIINDMFSIPWQHPDPNQSTGSLPGHALCHWSQGRRHG